jgi:hypothetical protein
MGTTTNSTSAYKDFRSDQGLVNTTVTSKRKLDTVWIGNEWGHRFRTGNDNLDSNSFGKCQSRKVQQTEAGHSRLASVFPFTIGNLLGGSVYHLEDVTFGRQFRLV